MYGMDGLPGSIRYKISIIGFDPVAKRKTFGLPGPIGGGRDTITRTALWIAARTVIVLGMILFGAKTDAGESQKSHENASIEEEKPETLWSGDFGVNSVSAYFAFGVMQENKGVIAEPFFDVARTLFIGGGLVNNVTLGLQFWSSMHSAETGANKSSAVPWWYEFDYYVPVGLTIAKKWTLTISYLDYEFPGCAFTAQRGVQTDIAYDDSELLGSLALHPHALILYNFEGVLGVGRTRAWYGEIGITPTASIAAKTGYPVNLSFPILLGCGDSHFYPGGAYGYFSVSANGSVPLAFLPKSIGSWTANAGITYYNLGEATATVNANRDHNAYVWQIGIRRTF